MLTSGFRTIPKFMAETPCKSHSIVMLTCRPSIGNSEPQTVSISSSDPKGPPISSQPSKSSRQQYKSCNSKPIEKTTKQRPKPPAWWTNRNLSSHLWIMIIMIWQRLKRPIKKQKGLRSSHRIKCLMVRKSKSLKRIFMTTFGGLLMVKFSIPRRLWMKPRGT